MSGFDDLVGELRAGVVRRAAGDTAATAPAALPARRRWWRSGSRLVPVSLVSTLSVTGAAVAAVTLLKTGTPVPSGTHDGLYFPWHAFEHVSVPPVRASDPDGGPPWGLLVTHPTAMPEGAICVTAGRVLNGRVGVIGIDGSFGNDGRFHETRPTSTASGMCGATTKRGVTFLGGTGLLVPASGYSGSTTAATADGRLVAGCSNPGERPTASQTTCPERAMRRVKYGFAGPEATRITFGNRRLHFSVTPTRGTSGAYLFVYRPSDAAAGGPMQLITDYPRGLRCTETIGIGADPRCMPPPGVR